jgi:aminobenzoyl-glutamate utilization protein B|tara:strand:- start:8490 stop:9923 length:1434 start_codon:yes stop_codon:yes gene_type:complete
MDKNMFNQILYITILFNLSMEIVIASDNVIKFLDSKSDEYTTMSNAIWALAELGYQEKETSKLMQSHLKEENFSINNGVAEIPTAFIASYGSGKPIIAILAEMDALPGLSQDAKPERKIIKEEMPGHACGHNLFGTGSIAAAVAVKNWLIKTGTTGTIRLYGTPAEEGGSGKVYMVRAGLFRDVDIVLHWHPSDRNDASPASSLANKSAKFRFHGIAAHAAAAPEKGRSALDAVESMNFMVNLMREHLPEPARIHYIITDGGTAPNIVPENAEVYYYVRHPNVDELERIWTRVIKVAKAAAIGTETTLEYEVIHANRPLLPNLPLANLVLEKLSQVGGVYYNEEEEIFAKSLRATLENPNRELGSEKNIQPFEEKVGRGSTDVGGISWVVPTAGFRTATWVPGTPGHSWQAVACGGMSIGHKGMMNAAKTLALSCIHVFQNPAIVEEAWETIQKQRGPKFDYYPLLGDRDPPLNYRD